MNKSYFLILMSLLMGASLPASAQRTTYMSEKIFIKSLSAEALQSLAFIACEFSLPEKRASQQADFIEGEECPPGGGECKYYGIINLNGREMRLNKVASGINSAVYEKDGVHLTTKLKTLNPQTTDDEGSDYHLTMVIRIKEAQRRVEMVGYCGI